MSSRQPSPSPAADAAAAPASAAPATPPRASPPLEPSSPPLFRPGRYPMIDAFSAAVGGKRQVVGTPGNLMRITHCAVGAITGQMMASAAMGVTIDLDFFNASIDRGINDLAPVLATLLEDGTDEADEAFESASSMVLPANFGFTDYGNVSGDGFVIDGPIDGYNVECSLVRPSIESLFGKDKAEAMLQEAIDAAAIKIVGGGEDKGKKRGAGEGGGEGGAKKRARAADGEAVETEDEDDEGGEDGEDGEESGSGSDDDDEDDDEDLGDLCARSKDDVELVVPRFIVKKASEL